MYPPCPFPAIIFIPVRFTGMAARASAPPPDQNVPTNRHLYMKAAMARFYLFRIPSSLPVLFLTNAKRFLSLTTATLSARSRSLFPLSVSCLLQRLSLFNLIPLHSCMDDRRALRSVYLCLSRSSRFTHFFSRPTVCH